ncbi:hypothetical protein D3C86_1060390 [compost metagenome]
MTIAHHAVLALVTDFLASLYERQDLAQHLACYHPDAWVPLGETLTKRGTLDAETYEAALVGLLETARPGAGGIPARFAIAGAGALEVDAHEALLVLPMREITQERQFEAAFLLRSHEGEWKLVGCSVQGPDAPIPTLATIEALIAGELAQAGVLSEPYELLLTPLDLAYRRAYPLEGAPLLTLPETRFTCQNSGECCKPSWDIPVPAATHDALDAAPWEALVPEIPRPFFEFATATNAGEPHRIASHDGACAFHRQNACTLHGTLGYSPIPVCATYPVGFTRTPEGICVWTYFTCPSARANIGEKLEARKADMTLRARMWRHGMLSVPETIALSHRGAEIPYALFAQVESALLDLLGEANRPLFERLQRMLGAGAALCEQAAHGPLTPETAHGTATEAPALTGEAMLASDGLSPYGTALYLVLAKHLPAALDGIAPAERLALPERLRGSEVRFVADEALLTRYVRQVLFRKKYLGEFGLVTHLNTVAWSAALVRDAALALALRDGRALTNDEDVHQAIKAVERSLTNSELLGEGVLRQAEYASLLQDPASGLV